jgi:hypothetical protein
MTTSITAGAKVDGGGSLRIRIIGAWPCGLTTLKNVLAAELRNVVTRSVGLSAFEDFPMPAHYPDFPSRQQVLAYFESYAIVCSETTAAGVSSVSAGASY